MAFAVAAGIFGLWAVLTYNRFVRLSRLTGEAWSGISVQLKRRRDLIPNLVEVVKGYAVHELELFEAVARARAEALKQSLDAPSPDLQNLEDGIGKFLSQIFVVSEAYPELRASDAFIRLHEALYDVEEQLQMARRYYNGTVRKYMILYESFPSLLVAKAFSFKPEAYFTLEGGASRLMPEISL